MITDDMLIMVAVELGFTYCEKGYSLEAAKADCLKQLHLQKLERADNDRNGDKK
jgi:hypothetical protein